MLTDIQKHVKRRKHTIYVLFPSSAALALICIENREEVPVDGAVPSCFAVSKPLPGPSDGRVLQCFKL